MEKFEKQQMSTMIEVMNSLQKKGFRENFNAKEKGLEDSSTKKIYSPENVKIVSFYRFEGESDPGDNSILYAIETDDGKKGVLVNSYGANTNQNVSKFITEVEDISKKERT